MGWCFGIIWEVFDEGHLMDGGCFLAGGFKGYGYQFWEEGLGLLGDLVAQLMASVDGSWLIQIHYILGHYTRFIWIFRRWRILINIVVLFCDGHHLCFQLPIHVRHQVVQLPLFGLLQS